MQFPLNKLAAAQINQCYQRGDGVVAVASGRGVAALLIKFPGPSTCVSLPLPEVLLSIRTVDACSICLAQSVLVCLV